MSSVAILSLVHKSDQVDCRCIYMYYLWSEDNLHRHTDSRSVWSFPGRRKCPPEK